MWRGPAALCIALSKEKEIMYAVAWPAQPAMLLHT